MIGQLSSDEDDDSSSSDSEDSECDSIINGETNNNNDELVLNIHMYYRGGLFIIGMVSVKFMGLLTDGNNPIQLYYRDGLS